MTTQTDNHARNQAEAQMQSIIEMVAALRVDYDRLEELRYEKSCAAWEFNYSLAGCLPDNPPLLFETLDEAKAAMIDELRERADELADAMHHDEQMSSESLDDFQDRARRYKEAIELDVSRLAAHGQSGFTVNGWEFWVTDDVEFEDADEMAELEEAAGGCVDIEDAEQQIQQHPLSVEVRSDWYTPGDDVEPGEFRIVLCTGGPHTQIRGELRDGEPVRAWLEYQDWGTPMTEYCGENHDGGALLEYANQFVFSVE